MTARIAIVGAGGHGRECLQIAEAMRREGADLEIVGFYDDAASDTYRALVEDLGYPILGNVDDLLRRPDLSVVLGVGSGRIREELDSGLLDRGITSPVLVHPDSTVGERVTLAPGAVIFAGARLTTNVSLGRHVHVNQNAAVAHDCVLNDYVTLNPLSAISGSVEVGTRATVGAGASVLQGVVVGADATVGAGACVVRDVDPERVVKGVPAR